MDVVEVTKPILLNRMTRYSGAGNFHSDDKAGQDTGLGGAIMQGGQLAGYLNEMMLRTLGPGYISGGEMSVTFIQPVRPGDTVTTKGVQKESTEADGRTRVTFEIWLENQNGEKCTVGTASGFVPD